MGTQRHHLTEITAERTESQRDTVATEHETQALRVTTESGDVEEFV